MADGDRSPQRHVDDHRAGRLGSTPTCHASGFSSSTGSWEATIVSKEYPLWNNSSPLQNHSRRHFDRPHGKVGTLSLGTGGPTWFCSGSLKDCAAPFSVSWHTLLEELDDLPEGATIISPMSHDRFRVTDVGHLADGSCEPTLNTRGGPRDDATRDRTVRDGTRWPIGLPCDRNDSGYRGKSVDFIHL